MDNAGNLRYYEPDFVILPKDGIHYITETKGLEDVNVANKDRAAHLWCENATRLTGIPWAYLGFIGFGSKETPVNNFDALRFLRKKND